ncbi:CDP-diacylglycerol--serine O-phosphatidyltransferase [candidate division KSB1 bacterium]|nr:CDP-diacylglycerol--serine O-phosphatidyltransferase [candidate division KSB1 bacterium]
MIKRKRDIVPSLFTMLNLFFGFFAIVIAIKGNFVQAAWLIIIAGIWDGIDGKIARMTHTYSEFGIQFDSITDVVSFGVAPSVLIYQSVFYKLGPLGIILSFLPLLLAAIRLSKFNANLDGFEKENFTGLPVPVMAATLATYVIFSYDLWEGMRFAPFLIPLVLFLCYLMVSHVEYEMMPKFSFRDGKKNSVLFIIMLLAIAAVVIFRQTAVFPMALGFVLYFWIRSLVHHHGEEEDEKLLDVSIPD